MEQRRPSLRYYPLNIKCLITQEARVLSDGCVGIEGGAEGSLVTGHHLAMCAGGGPRTLFQMSYPGENTEGSGPLILRSQAHQQV